ncbi:hypothetical protein E3_0460 [Rhodococcus phage E3]|uniref:hypothetical protein n=1 Tax=Rhodococcus phage E3 TaxID=1007869 RepID=UPI0002C6A0C7|nr:hypothetical protein M176_gp049 [Rhodococcus phage E3]AEQ20959.1 hypothetical protein E3_0460 [Rhodococcus phage E3]
MHSEQTYDGMSPVQEFSDRVRNMVPKPMVVTHHATATLTAEGAFVVVDQILGEALAEIGPERRNDDQGALRAFYEIERLREKIAERSKQQ